MMSHSICVDSQFKPLAYRGEPRPPNRQLTSRTVSEANDFGVNHDGGGGLFGFAYGANIGWIKFAQDWNNPPRVDLLTGQLSGYAYSANVGWVDLGSDAVHFVSTNAIDPGPDSDEDAIPDSWELEQVEASGSGTGTIAGDLALLGEVGDFDSDGLSDSGEFLADSNPFDGVERFRIIELTRVGSPGNNVTLEWTSSPRRIYDINGTEDLGAAFSIAISDILPSSGTTTIQLLTELPETESKFYNVSARVPLSP